MSENEIYQLETMSEQMLREYARQLEKKVDELTIVIMKQPSVSALTAERDALKAQQEWRPIETAPKDGKFLVINTSGYMFVMAGEILECQRTAKHKTPDHLRFEVTHWQPLPPPPATQARTDSHIRE